MKYTEYLPQGIELRHRDGHFSDLLLGDEAFPYHVAPEPVSGEYSYLVDGVGVAYVPVLFEHAPGLQGLFVLGPNGLGE